jgi:hypothetical protein
MAVCLNRALDIQCVDWLVLNDQNGRGGLLQQLPLASRELAPTASSVRSMIAATCDSGKASSVASNRICRRGSESLVMARATMPAFLTTPPSFAASSAEAAACE